MYFYIVFHKDDDDEVWADLVRSDRTDLHTEEVQQKLKIDDDEWYGLRGPIFGNEIINLDDDDFLEELAEVDYETYTKVEDEIDWDDFWTDE